MESSNKENNEQCLFSLAGILSQVLSFVGPGHWLFIAAVNKWWRARYAELPRLPMPLYPIRKWERRFTCSPCMTLFSAAFASRSRVRLAVQCGLDCSKENSMYTAGRAATITTLVAAEELGLQLTYITMCGAARAGSTLKLQWLREEHNCCLTDNLCVYAAMGGSISTLRWLKQQGCAFTAYCCYNATYYNHLSTLQYLRSEGCAWDSKVLEMSADKLELFKWADENGCPGDANAVCTAVAAGGSVPVLTYLQQRGFIQHTYIDWMTHLLNVAGAHNRLAAVQWFRQQGAEWPDVLQYMNVYRSCSTLAYARYEGCTSPAAPAIAEM
jgi:hypothetical protein